MLWEHALNADLLQQESSLRERCALASKISKWPQIHGNRNSRVLREVAGAALRWS
jgi:hypothetical protein